MASFKDTLKKYFYGTGASALASTANACVLDASGNPIGCDSLDRVSAYTLNKDSFVDMGLPSGRLWAKCNVGALKETDYGYYFSWGNLNGHSEGSGYNFNETNYNASPAASISTDLTVSQDAARANFGKAWRMPTKDEFVELLNSEYTEFVDTSGNVISGTDKRTTVNGVVGFRIKSKANGNILFFPATGHYSGTSISDKGVNCIYWTSSFYSNVYAYNINVGSIVYAKTYAQRYFGIAIRPVI